MTNPPSNELLKYKETLIKISEGSLTLEQRRDREFLLILIEDVIRPMAKAAIEQPATEQYVASKDISPMFACAKDLCAAMDNGFSIQPNSAFHFELQDALENFKKARKI